MIRVLILTSSCYGTASRCLPALVDGKSFEVTAVILVEGNIWSRKYNFYQKKWKKVRQIGLLGALNGIRIRRWFQSDPTEHLKVLCRRHKIPFYRSNTL